MRRWDFLSWAFAFSAKQKRGWTFGPLFIWQFVRVYGHFVIEFKQLFSVSCPTPARVSFEVVLNLAFSLMIEFHTYVLQLKSRIHARQNVDAYTTKRWVYPSASFQHVIRASLLKSTRILIEF